MILSKQIGMSLPSLSNTIRIDPKEIKRKSQQELQKTERYLSLIMVPLCMSEVLWDFVDTVVDMTSRLRITALKSVTRKLREFRRDYQYAYEKNPQYKSSHFDDVKAWRNDFLDKTDGDHDTFAEIDGYLKTHYAGLDSEWRMTISSAYLAWMYAKAITRFSERQERDFAKTLGLPNVGHMLPEQLYTLPVLLGAIIEETPIDPSITNRIIGEIDQYMTKVVAISIEPDKRTEHRYNCIAYICNKGCKAHAITGQKYGCYPSSACKRMKEYDKRH